MRKKDHNYDVETILRLLLIDTVSRVIQAYTYLFNNIERVVVLCCVCMYVVSDEEQQAHRSRDTLQRATQAR
jgi:hypothetical protein